MYHFLVERIALCLLILQHRVCKVNRYKLILWFSDTGLEFPEVRDHVKHFGEWLKEKYDIEKYNKKNRKEGLAKKEGSPDRKDLRCDYADSGYCILSAWICRKLLEYQLDRISGGRDPMRYCQHYPGKGIGYA